jgi:S1-C subfamily serine protease
MMTTFRFLFFVAVMALAGCQTAGTMRLRDNIAPCAVEVFVDGRLEGSGWFAKPGDVVVTAAHVAPRKPARLEIMTASRERMPVSVLALDRGHDLVLLRLPSSATNHLYLAVADGVPAPGSEVYVYGAAQFRHDLLLPGRVARQTPSFECYGGERYVNVYYVGGASPHGISGGCWVDCDGRVVGNQSGYMRHHDAPSGVALVAPPDAIRRLVSTRQSAQTPTIQCAIEELWERPVDFIKRFPAGTEGVVTMNVATNGPAYQAGLRKEHVVISADGKRVRLRDDFMNVIVSHKPGETIPMNVLKADDPTPIKISVRLEQLEELVP